MRILLSVSLLACAALAHAAQSASPPITYDEAVANEKKLFAADQQHDMDIIKSIVADDFVDIGKDGSSIGKEALLKEIPAIKLLKYAQQNFRVTVLGPFAYSISYDSDATMIADGKEMRSQNPLNTVWIKRDGRWQMLLHCRGEMRELSAK
jgi:hypothetical protein